MSTAHSERKHSDYSASGSERWFNCPGSVALSRGLPDRDSVWSIEGTKAHEVLERILTNDSSYNLADPTMLRYGKLAARFIRGFHERSPGSDLLVETRIHLSFIHPEMFGTFDGAVVDYFGTLHVFDYKYGAGHMVSPGSIEKPNLQMVFYGIGLAHQYAWNFQKARLWIIQPRVKGYDGPQFLEMPIEDLKAHVGQFERAVRRVEKFPKKYVEGSWCHWCKAKGVCPLKLEQRNERKRSLLRSFE